MVAAAYKALLKFACERGEAFTIPCTASDVNAENYTYPDGEEVLTLPGNKGVVALVDVILTGAGTDTSTASLFVNGRATPEKILNSACLATNVSRQFMGVPIKFAPGSSIKITQNT